MGRRVVTRLLPEPAAGADIKYEPSQSDPVRLLSLHAKLTTSATVDSRRVALSFLDESAVEYWTADLAALQAASLAVTYSWSPRASTVALATLTSGERAQAGFPGFWLQPGDTIATVTALLQAGDQWSNIVVRYQICEVWEHLQMMAQLEAALAE